MPPWSVIGADRLPNGDVVCVSTTGRSNRISSFDGAEWRCLAEWKGKEVTACCVAGGVIVAPALDGVLYVWANGALEKLALPGPELWMYGACSLPDGRALMGGTGLVFYSPQSGAVTRRRLGEYGVDRPGRKVHGVTRTGSRVFVSGARNLLLEYVDDTLLPVAPEAFAGRELLIHAAVAHADRLWLTGFGQVAALEGGVLTLHGNPAGEDRNQVVGIRLMNGEPLFFQTKVVAGVPPDCRLLAEGFHPGGLVAVVGSPNVGDLVAIAWTGQSYLIRDREVRELLIT